MEILARELGVTLQITDAGGDTAKQIADVDDLLTRGVDALVIPPAVADALGPAIERAYDAGIPVMVFQSSPGTDKYTHPSSMPTMPSSGRRAWRSWPRTWVGPAT